MIVFLNNPTSDPIDASIPKWNLTITVQPYEIRPIEIGCEIRPGLTFDSGTARVLRTWTAGDETTIVVDGKAGGNGVLNVKSGGDIWTSNTPFRSRMFSMARRDVGGFHVRILGVCSDMTDDTWYIDTPKGVATVFKPDFVGDFDLKGADVRLTVERSLDSPDDGLIVRLPSGKYTNVASQAAPPTLPVAPELSPWTFRRADDGASPKFDDAKWLRSESPRPMGADGDTSAYAWYRTTVNAPTAGDYTLRFADAGDWITAFVDGARQASSEVHMRFDKPAPRTLKIHLSAGKSEIAVFAAHLGRHKLFNYLGPFDTIDAKGISGAVILCKGDDAVGEPVLDWRMRGGIEEAQDVVGWRPISGDAPAAPAFYRTAFVAASPASNVHIVLRLAVAGLSRGFAWLNGHNLGRYPEKKTPSPGLYLPECWIKPGKNSLVVFDEEGRSPANAKLVVERQASGARFTVRIP